MLWFLSIRLSPRLHAGSDEYPGRVFIVSGRRAAVCHISYGIRRRKKIEPHRSNDNRCGCFVIMEFDGVSSLLILGVLHRLLAFCDAQRRGGFERWPQRSASGGRIVFVSDNVAPQSGQRGEQFFLL